MKFFKVKARIDVNYPWIEKNKIIFEKGKIYDACIGKSPNNLDIYYLNIPLNRYQCMLFTGRFNLLFINITEERNSIIDDLLS